MDEPADPQRERDLAYFRSKYPQVRAHEIDQWFALGAAYARQHLLGPSAPPDSWPWAVPEADLRELERDAEFTSRRVGAPGSVVRERANIVLRMVSSYRLLVVENVRLRDGAAPAYGLPDTLRAANTELHEWREASEVLGYVTPAVLRARVLGLQSDSSRLKRIRTMLKVEYSVDQVHALLLEPLESEVEPPERGETGS